MHPKNLSHSKFKISKIFVLLLSIVSLSAANAATYMVTNTNDSGPGSLREAMINANSSPGQDQIKIAIPGPGIKKIELLTLLPVLVDSVIVDGKNTQGSQSKIVLEGSKIAMDSTNDCLSYLKAFGTSFSPLFPGYKYIGKRDANLGMVHLSGHSADNSTIKNLVFSISVNKASAIKQVPTIEPPYAGKNMGSELVDELFNARENNGLVVRGPCTGVTVATADNVTIKDSSFSGFLIGNAAVNTSASNATTVEGNLVVGEVNDGIEIGGGTGSVIKGNLVQGNLLLQSEGIYAGGSNTIVEFNDVSGAQLNVSVSYGSMPNTVRYNYIHDGIAGVSLITLPSFGIPLIGNKVHNNIITRVATGINNHSILAAAVPGNSNHSFIGNSIFDLKNNIRPDVFQMPHPIGIDLSAVPQTIIDWPIGDNHTPNDNLDSDVGPNNLQNFPILISGTMHGNTLTLTGVLNSVPGKTYYVEFFANDSSVYEGKIPLGNAIVTTDLNGNGTINSGIQTQGLMQPSSKEKVYITSTATECADSQCSTKLSTSEFSDPFAVKAKHIPLKF